MITVVLADDHPIVRQGLRHLLESDAEFKVVGEASDGVETIQSIETTKPDVLVVDMMMPGLNGLAVLQRLKKISPTTHAIVLSMHSANAYVVRALNFGAEGYVLKETGPSELVEAIHTVVQGNRYISQKLLDRFEASSQGIEDAPLDTYQTLTIREREILQLTVEGKSSSEIGERLVISPRTVEVHRSKVMKKLGLHSMADLVRYAIKRGIISMDDT